MALETNDNNEAFLSGGGGEDDFAALDSMGLTGQSQYGMNTVHMSSSTDNIGSNNNVGSTPATTQTTGASGVSDGSSGFSGVSGSLFDRIKARTAEQQKASVSNTQQQPPAPQQQEAAQSSSQQSAFMSQQQQSQQPPSGEVTVELERHRSDEFNSSAPTNLSSNMPSQNQNTAIPNNNNNETTYSFSASGAGEDFSQQAQQQMRVPDYGVNRYAGASGNQQQYPQNIQDQALSTMKSLWSNGINSAQNTIAIAQQKMGIETNGSDATPRSYNNNFLLREDSMEAGGGIGATMQQQQPPQPISAAQFDPEHVQAGSSSTNASSGMSGIMGEQGYSMLQYGKTFCEDMYAFVMQLPPVGKGAVGIILLWILYVLFG